MTLMDLLESLGRRWPGEPGSGGPEPAAHRGPSVSMPPCKLSFCFAGFTKHGFISCDCAISGGVNIAGGLFKKANDLKCFGVVLFFPPFSFPLELSPRGRPAQAMCGFNLLAFSSNFPFLSRDMLEWQTKGRKDMRIKTQSPDRGPREGGNVQGATRKRAGSHRRSAAFPASGAGV